MLYEFSHDRYLLTKKFFKLVGATFRIFDESGNLSFFVKQKAFKLREDIRVYSDESMTDELLLIKARRIIDFSAAYDVIDAKTNETIGTFKRKGMKSIIKDEWIIMNNTDTEIGIIKEDKMILALIRRSLTNLIPQTFNGFIGDSMVFKFKQRFNPILFKMNLDFSNDTTHLLDRRMGISAAILLGAIEGRQNN